MPDNKQNELTDLTLAGARDKLRAREISSRELTEAHIAAVEDARDLNAFITETPDQALAMADASDARLAAGEGGGIEGIPVAIKDLFVQKVCKPRQPRTFWKASCPNMRAPSPRTCGTPAA